jgi:hypothetical protein
MTRLRTLAGRMSAQVKPGHDDNDLQAQRLAGSTTCRLKEMRGLKILVVVMGVMLVVGFAALVAVIAGRVSSRGGSAPTIPRAFAPAVIEIPRDSRIEAITAGPDRLVLGLALPTGGRQLVVIDLATGARLGTIELRAAP